MTCVTGPAGRLAGRPGRRDRPGRPVQQARQASASMRQFRNALVRSARRVIDVVVVAAAAAAAALVAAVVARRTTFFLGVPILCKSAQWACSMKAQRTATADADLDDCGKIADHTFFPDKSSGNAHLNHDDHEHLKDFNPFLSNRGLKSGKSQHYFQSRGGGRGEECLLPGLGALDEDFGHLRGE